MNGSSDHDKPMNERELEDAAHWLGRAVNLLEESLNAACYAEGERREVAQAFKSVQSVYRNIEARQEIAGTDWQKTEDRLEALMEELEDVMGDLPDRQKAEADDAARRVLLETENARDSAYEAASAAKDLTDEQ